MKPNDVDAPLVTDVPSVPVEALLDADAQFGGQGSSWIVMSLKNTFALPPP
jgi:hypothetical protein